jgi:hypothetical protein
MKMTKKDEPLYFVVTCINEMLCPSQIDSHDLFFRSEVFDKGSAVENDIITMNERGQ